MTAASIPMSRQTEESNKASSVSSFMLVGRWVELQSGYTLPIDRVPEKVKSSLVL